MKTSNQIISESGADRIKVIKLSGEVIEDVTLKDLMVQAGDISQFDTLVLEIASPGG